MMLLLFPSRTDKEVVFWLCVCWGGGGRRPPSEHQNSIADVSSFYNINFCVIGDTAVLQKKCSFMSWNSAVSVEYVANWRPGIWHWCHGLGWAAVVAVCGTWPGTFPGGLSYCLSGLDLDLDWIRRHCQRQDHFWYMGYLNGKKWHQAMIVLEWGKKECLNRSLLWRGIV